MEVFPGRLPRMLERVHWMPLFRYLDEVDVSVFEAQREADSLGDLPIRDCVSSVSQEKPEKIDRQKSSYGPMSWNTGSSVLLQEAIDQFGIDEIYNLEFSVTIASPMQPDCPLVACSAGFTELTGYEVGEIVGRNCRFLLTGVPTDEINEDARLRCRMFIEKAKKNIDYDGDNDNLPPGMRKPWPELAKGELICVQTNAKKTGELFRNVFYMRQVEVDDNPFIIALQFRLPDDGDDLYDLDALERKCKEAYARLDESMSTIERILAAHFWFTAPMRRQN